MKKESNSENSDMFASNLQKFLLSEDDIRHSDLMVSSRSSITLSRSAKHASNYSAISLQTTDLDELKRWIGMPDDAVKSRSFVSRTDRAHVKELCEFCKYHETERPADRRNLLISRIREDKQPAAKTTSLRAYTRSYLFGDSEIVAEAKSVLQDFYGTIDIGVWLFPNVTVKSGSVLSFGTGSNVLLANNLVIEEGGSVVSQGSLSVNVTTLRKTVPSITYPYQDLDFIKNRFATRYRA
jgi:hypothetical protein